MSQGGFLATLSDLAEREDDWTYRLSADDIAALDDAVARIAARDMDVLDINARTVPAFWLRRCPQGD